jgi:methyltransferase-like protein
MTRNLDQFAYDEVPYPSIPKPESHPARLSTLAALHGLAPAPVERCRVLELACSDGGNIIPMAFSLPESQFVGVDLSARQIADGRLEIEELGLTNISLEHLSILDFDERFGLFDYIIAYGVFSWVDRTVQEKIFEICKKNLAPSGVAYVSYNVYPGWHLRGLLREMMLYRTRGSGDLSSSVRAARDLLKFLTDSVRSINETRRATTLDMNAYAVILQREQDLLEKRPDLYLAHDLLEDVNEPIYFNEFIERAGRHGLQYLIESDYSTTRIDGFPPAVAEELRRLDLGVIGTEQYIDFLLNRTFRQTLLCHDHVPVQRELRPEQVRGLYVGSAAKPISENPNVEADVSERFRAPSGTVISVRTPLAKAGMLYLSDIWPSVVHFDELMVRAHQRLDPTWLPVQSAEKAAHEAQSMADMLVKFFALDMIELHTYAPRFVMRPGERPAASRLARYQTAHTTAVTNLRHEQVVLADDATLHLLPFMDGSRNREDLLGVLDQMVREGVLVTLTGQAGGAAPPANGHTRPLMEQVLDRSLQWLARSALLVD